MKTDLRSHIKDKLNAVELDDAQYRALTGHGQRAQASLAQSRSGGGWLRRWPRLAAGVALVAMVAVGALYLGWMTLSVDAPAQTRRLAQAIAEEVASNHLKARPLELMSRDMGEVQAFFTALDFKPINSRWQSAADGDLLGGRYCSIQGVSAAQLRFQSAGADDTHSLYQTVWSEAKFGGLPVLDQGASPLTVYARGMAVQIWVERGVVFAKTLPVGVN